MKVFEDGSRFIKYTSSHNPSFLVYQYIFKGIGSIQRRSAKLFCFLSKCALRRASLDYKHIRVRVRVPTLKYISVRDLVRAATLFSDVVVPLYTMSLRIYVPQSLVAVACMDEVGKKVSKLLYAALVAEKDSKFWERTAFILVLVNAPERLKGKLVRHVYSEAWRKISTNIPNASTSPPPMVSVLVISFEKGRGSTAVTVLVKDMRETHIVKLPLRRPSWSLDNLPNTLRNDLQTLVIDPVVSGAKYAPRGLLVIGPPGVGKTVLAEAVASALGLNIVEVRPSMFRSAWYGFSEKTLGKILDTVGRRRDVIVVIDDADFFSSRYTYPHPAHVAEVNTILSFLQRESRPLVVLTTNLPELIDPAITRAGRIDVTVIMGYPDKEMRRMIVETSTSKYGIDVAEDAVDSTVLYTRWFSSAEVDALVRTAACRGRGKVSVEDVEWARARFIVNVGEREEIQERLRTLDRSATYGMVIKYVPQATAV